MRLVPLAVATAVALLGPGRSLAAGEAAAENDSPFGGFTWSFAGGPAVPLFDAARRFPMGGQVAASLGYRLFDRLVVQVEYLFSNHGVSADFIKQNDLAANHLVHAGNLGLQLDVLPRGGPVELYVVGGPGIYGRSVEISTRAGGAIPQICEPGLLICTAGVSPASEQLAKGTVIDFGLDAGVGASVSLGHPVRLFLEARFHYIWGSLNTPEGPRSANGQYLPVSIGLRFF